MYPSAKVILDSISPSGNRLTTMEVTIHRFVLAEFNTHRVFSRNSASSRAIPVEKMIAKAMDDPAIPLFWPAEQKGMQGGDQLDTGPRREAFEVWQRARMGAIESATALTKLGLHKSVVNRLLEPFLPHTIIVSSTEWTNFFAQRCNPAAQPEMRAAAEQMRGAYLESTPEPLGIGEWHTPYITPEDDADGELIPVQKRLFVSAARCARVSYLTQDGRRDYKEDLALFNRLVTARPGHWSPLEHVATPQHPDYESRLGNFRGWDQLRHSFEPAPQVQIEAVDGR